MTDFPQSKDISPTPNSGTIRIVIRIFGQSGQLGVFGQIDEAVSFLEHREGKRQGELEWVRLHLRSDLAVDLEPPMVLNDYRLEHDLDGADSVAS